MKLIASEVSDLLAAIEFGWAKPVPAASHTHIDAYGEISHEDSFYHIDGKVFMVTYLNRTTINEYYEIDGENLDMFLDYYKLREVVA